MSFRTKFIELFKEIGVKYPIVSAPMAYVTSVELATQVTRAGGLGFIPAGVSTAEGLDQDLTRAKHLFDNGPTEILPIGVGFFNFILDSQTGRDEKHVPSALKTVLSHKPAAVWFTFVESAITSANLGVDVIVAQGCDSGGHGLANNASALTLVPETIDALNDCKNGHIPVLAAGGIMDGRGLTAMLVLGASGVVMGTRFAASRESLSKPAAKEMLVNARDGGVCTVRTSVFDNLKQPNIWPKKFDGRALKNKTFEEGDIDFGDEEKTAERRRIYSDAVKNGDYSRAVIYAGTGIGLAKEIMSAKEIIESTMNEARTIMGSVAKL
ncbi:4319_t:CDS:2 [Acaulospora colombiana]|uniref:4319_t:CDS:1 n=1 Tax=Acaulospora colombiana TaxID=27376 RepID=A0ACA9L1V2_9GLOM|nr:4319_t:CDS:2 [Acaulospora colombiana]